MNAPLSPSAAPLAVTPLAAEVVPLKDAAGAPTRIRWARWLGVLCLGAGIFGGVASLVAGGMAYGLGEMREVGTAGSWLVCALVWVGAALRLRHRRPGPAYWILSTALWAAFLAWWRYPSLETVFFIARSTHPWLPLSIQGAGLSAALIVLGCVWRLWTLRAESRPPPRGVLKKLLAGGGLAAALAWPAFGLPGLLQRHLRAQIRQMKAYYFVGDQPKLILGAVPEEEIGSRPFRGVAVPPKSESGREPFAELESLRAAGAKVVLIRAGGEAFLFNRKDELERAEAYAKQARALGLKIVLADVPTALPRRLSLTWLDFTLRHKERIQWYLKHLHPEGYIINSNILTYHRLGEIQDKYQIKTYQRVWLNHISAMAELIKGQSPATLTGVLLQPWIPEEWDIYRKLLGRTYIDVIGFEAYEVAELEAAQRTLAQFGHPEDTAQRLWLLGTFSGRPVRTGRDTDRERAWLEMVLGWAQSFGVEAVFVRPGGTFVPGGNLKRLANGELEQAWRARPELSRTGRHWKELAARVGRDLSEPHRRIRPKSPEREPGKGEAPPAQAPEKLRPGPEDEPIPSS